MTGKKEDPAVERLLECVRLNPGITGRVIQEQFRPMHPKGTISNTLGRLRRQGFIENRGAGGPHSVWYPVDHEAIDPAFTQMAKTLMEELRDVYPVSERESYLARRLEALFMQNIFAEEAS